MRRRTDASGPSRPGTGAGIDGVLAIDQGTTNTKAVLVDGTGTVVARASRPVDVKYPRPGWVEQDAGEIWDSVRVVIDECLAAHGAWRVALAVTNQREAAVLWDRRGGRPLGPVVGWQCRRTSAACAALREAGHEALVRARTGLTIDPMFSATKLRWLIDQAPDGAQRAARGELCAGTIDTWLLWNLTGGAVHATDFTNAARTQLLDLTRLTWDPELAEIFGVPTAALPALRPSSARLGQTIALGRLPAGTPILAVAGDSHAALCGHGAFAPGAIKATYGTGSSLMTPTARRVSSHHGLSSTVAWARGDTCRYALEGNIPISGAAVDWLAGLLGLRGGAADVLALAAVTADSAGAVIVPALAGLGAPHWDAEARGLIQGLTRGTTAAHLARAVLEAVAFQVRDVFEAMQADAGIRFESLLADGGLCRSDLLMQMQADLLGRPVRRARESDGAALGAAYLAGIEAGLWPSVAAVEALPRGRDLFEPVLDAAAREAHYARWRQSVARARSAPPEGTRRRALEPRLEAGA